MRLGKYLKVSRLIRRHTVANEARGARWVVINGKVARAPYGVEEGDVLGLQLGAHNLKVRIVRVSECTPKKEASEMYGAVP